MDYTYDAWARLKTAVTTGSTQYPQWGLSWDYDRYGNRKSQNVIAGAAGSMQLTISESSNRISYIGSVATAYDASGNLTKDDQQRYVFDAENRVVQVKNLANTSVLASYSYDGAGLRVKKTASGSTTLYIFSGTKVIAEYAPGAALNSPSREYIYAGSQLLATLAGSTPTYHHADHLSTRVFTDAAGAKSGERGHYPFGEMWYETGTTDKCDLLPVFSPVIM